MNPDLLLIVGPTAVGKTALSLQIAEEFDGEVISGDSMQVYREMDIGTAKASEEERRRVPHHLIDIIDPDTPFSVQEFQALARQKIEEIAARGHLPMLVGGTGLYIEAVTHGYKMPYVEENTELRRELHLFAEREGNKALHQRLYEVDPVSAEKLHPNDRRRIIRALEVYHATGKPFSQITGKKESPYHLLWVGLTMPRDLLYERINQRVDQMISAGLVDEVKRLKEKGYHRNLTSMQAIGYKEIMSFLEGEMTFPEAVDLIKKGTRKYAKRQFSWFRRIPEIHWFDVTKDESFEEIQRLVAGKFLHSRE
ncbi:tRNA (adenosine(37)-N6)-dimethylallyltransferase MiaA [Paenactinomyces guangxiensis]|uniref:tRNA dimethylallyltransferase n=1 Tax=Paenactinomyces guangxiensis TaxID=1490290 RepID=A0A7W1WQX3_9BACL|nr:tRNA (adenosine(37)-N6)-dimethylallyltransferase MiaA [Paenactinomyces guangxiensis]MBA4494442.1 tRNA (adenosine(37)-N6)-dimethylallyltransferase MiaA [Paenactinomyces guangxiensis]MBH8591503.1 tRNA (adenosine(37)-N6)-dimethylallyltransferase MiaA [Paenactinomyces guangxiensis]